LLLTLAPATPKISWIDGDTKSVEAPGAKYYEKDLKDDAVYTEVKN
jgi:hypothetical protein